MMSHALGRSKVERVSPLSARLMDNQPRPMPPMPQDLLPTPSSNSVELASIDHGGKLEQHSPTIGNPALAVMASMLHVGGGTKWCFRPHWLKTFVFLLFSSILVLSVVSYLTTQNSGLVQIALFGDSLIYNSDRQYTLSMGILQKLSILRPANQINIYAFGHGGYRIDHLRNHLGVILQRQTIKSLFGGSTSPHAVVVYFDSDCSDVDETPDTVGQIRAVYLDNLRYVLAQLTAYIPCVILAGPTLIGERPHGQNSKDTMLDDYVAMNRAISLEYNVTYVDTRSVFFSALPSDWKGYEGYLTVDGEHHNSHGVLLIRNLFVRALDSCPGLQPLWAPAPPH